MSNVNDTSKAPGVAAIKERLDRDHHRILGLAENLKALLNGPAPAEVEGLVAARWAFASALIQHLAIKERHIYAKLENDPRSDVNAFGQRSKADLQRCFDAYTSHMQEWSTTRALGSWLTYRTLAISVVNAFIDRLRWEAKDMLIFVDAYQIDISMPSPVTSNWVRKAFEVKSSVEDH